MFADPGMVGLSLLTVGAVVLLLGAGLLTRAHLDRKPVVDAAEQIDPFADRLSDDHDQTEQTDHAQHEDSQPHRQQLTHHGTGDVADDAAVLTHQLGVPGRGQRIMGEVDDPLESKEQQAPANPLAARGTVVQGVPQCPEAHHQQQGRRHI